MAAESDSNCNVSMRLMGDMSPSEMLQKNRCILMKVTEELTSHFSPAEISQSSGELFNIQPPIMHYKDLTAMGGILVSPVYSLIPHFTAALHGLSKRTLLHEGAALSEVRYTPSDSVTMLSRIATITTVSLPRLQCQCTTASLPP